MGGSSDAGGVSCSTSAQFRDPRISRITQIIDGTYFMIQLLIGITYIEILDVPDAFCAVLLILRSTIACVSLVGLIRFPPERCDSIPPPLPTNIRLDLEQQSLSQFHAVSMGEQAHGASST